MDGGAAKDGTESIFALINRLGLLPTLNAEQRKRFSGLRIRYSQRLIKAAVESVTQYPDLAPPRWTAQGLLQQDQDIQVLIGVRDAARKLLDATNNTLTLRMGHLSVRVLDGVDYMRPERRAGRGRPDAGGLEEPGHAMEGGA